MKNSKFQLTTLTLMAIWTLSGSSAEAKRDESWEFGIYSRFYGGYTYSQTATEPKGYEGSGWHYGFGFFERQDRNNAAGIEFGWGSLYTKDSGDYEVSTVGLILERKFMKEFMATLGAVGYFGSEDFDGAYFGIRIGGGYETYISRESFISVLYRYDYIYATESITSSNLTLGIGVDF